MQAYFVEKQTSALAKMAAVIAPVIAPVIAALTLLLGGNLVAAETCESLFSSPSARTPGSHVVLVDHQIIEAIQTEPRALRMTEISEVGLSLFLANLTGYAAEKGFESHHDLIELRVYKFRHGEAGTPFSHYQAEVSFNQNGTDYDIDLQFYSNGHVGYLVTGPAATLESRAVARGSLGHLMTFSTSALDAFAPERPRGVTNQP